jgi:hypothetical protein
MQIKMFFYMGVKRRGIFHPAAPLYKNFPSPKASDLPGCALLRADKR